MREERAADADSSEAAADAAEEIRVTDRRRISIDDEPDDDETKRERAERTDESAPSKPKYVEELEMRARAAEHKLVEVQARFEQLRAQLQRETDETRQRLNRAADERARREKVDFISALLPVADNLQRAIAAAEKGGSFETLLDGVRGTANGFESALASAGVESVASIGAQFDPELHEAVDTIEVEPERDGEVTAEYGRGFSMGGVLLRPARVQVGRAQAQSKQAAE
ncbi:MAG: nucleotide exchange factor GrpE [Pyrinomonadaceae bacterium]